MNRATERMLAFARDIAAELDMELPTTTNADGESLPRIKEAFDTTVAAWNRRCGDGE